MKTASEVASKAGSVSPVLPKRHPVVNLRDQRSKSKENPDILITEASPSPSGSTRSLETCSDPEVIPEAIPEVVSEDVNASSAFDSATFYV